MYKSLFERQETRFICKFWSVLHAPGSWIPIRIRVPKTIPDSDPHHCIFMPSFFVSVSIDPAVSVSACRKTNLIRILGSQDGARKKTRRKSLSPHDIPVFPQNLGEYHAWSYVKQHKLSPELPKSLFRRCVLNSVPDPDP
jgi:hypothetical protein